MPLNKTFEGREFPASDPFEVTADSIREFADAIGDPNPAFHDGAVIAPPTYLTKLSFIFMPPVVLDPELGLNYMMVVHGDQEFEYVRPLRAGDVLVGKPRIASITARGRNEFMSTEARIETTSGEHVATMRSTIVSRGTAEEAN